MNLFIIVCCTFALPCVACIKATNEAGKRWAEEQAKTICENLKKSREQDFIPEELNDQKFDGEKAALNMKNGNIPKNETYDFLMSDEVQNNQRKKLFHHEEIFIKNSEQIFANKHPSSNLKNETLFTIYTCKMEGDPFLMSTERTLKVNVKHIRGEIAKVCNGHSLKALVKNKGGFKRSIIKLDDKYKADPTIDPESIKITLLHEDRMVDLYCVRISYKHIINTSGCDHCEAKKIKSDQYEELSDEWIYDQQDLWNLSKSPDHTILEHTCLDATPSKVINGKTVYRKCWKEKITFLYQLPSKNDCNFLKKKNCEQIKQECIQVQSNTCAEWLLTFRCLEKISSTPVEFDQEFDNSVIDYVPNQSFSEVTTKLAVFAEAKKEMEKSKGLDVTKLKLFEGKRMSCSKNVAEGLMYDCCFKYSGLAKQAGLTKCSADEIVLAEMREQGQCYYVGSYEEKFMDLWKSKDEHVFCCYPTQLAYLVQKEGRKQLNINWGTPKEPNCRGFTIQELNQLNFSKLDLSELFKKIPQKMPDDLKQRLETFQNRLRQDIEQSNVKK